MSQTLTSPTGAVTPAELAAIIAKPIATLTLRELRTLSQTMESASAGNQGATIGELLQMAPPPQ